MVYVKLMLHLWWFFIIGSNMIACDRPLVYRRHANRCKQAHLCEFGVIY